MHPAPSFLWYFSKEKRNDWKTIDNLMPIRFILCVSQVQGRLLHKGQGSGGQTQRLATFRTWLRRVRWLFFTCARPVSTYWAMRVSIPVWVFEHITCAYEIIDGEIIFLVEQACCHIIYVSWELPNKGCTEGMQKTFFLYTSFTLYSLKQRETHKEKKLKIIWCYPPFSLSLQTSSAI